MNTADRFSITAQLEHLQQKCVGWGLAGGLSSRAAPALPFRPCRGRSLTVPLLSPPPPPPIPLHRRYVGTGHADITRFDWASNIKRDTYASLVGHHSLSAYHAIAENESVGRVKYAFMQNMLLPCGLPPEKEDE